MIYLIRVTKLTVPVLFGDVWLKFPEKVQRMLVTLRLTTVVLLFVT